MILTRDPALFEIVSLSLRVSGTALLFSTLVGIPLGAALGLSRFAGRGLLIALLYTGMGFPPVVIGLFVVAVGMPLVRRFVILVIGCLEKQFVVPQGWRC